MKPFKSERAAKLHMAKLDRAYDVAIHARNNVGANAHLTGWSDEMFAERRKHEAEMHRVYDLMTECNRAASAQGFYVVGRWFKYMNSTHAALVAANRD